jgi:hypothetical protein
MTTKDEMIKTINALAEKQYGENSRTFLWGASRVFLDEKDLAIILEMLNEKESEMLEQ